MKSQRLSGEQAEVLRILRQPNGRIDAVLRLLSNIVAVSDLDRRYLSRPTLDALKRHGLVEEDPTRRVIERQRIGGRDLPMCVQTTFTIAPLGVAALETGRFTPRPAPAAGEAP